MTIDLDELERLARAATEGPWRWDLDVFDEGGEIEACVEACVDGGKPHITMLFRAGTGLRTTVDGNTPETWDNAGEAPAANDAAYIAAMNPAVALALIAELREAREALKRALLPNGATGGQQPSPALMERAALGGEGGK